MSGTIHVRYDEVYKKVNTLTSYINSEILQDAQAKHNQINSILEQVDGNTNAGLLEAMSLNRTKVEAAGNILLKLLGFMESSARELEKEEAKMAEQISASGEEA